MLVFSRPERHFILGLLFLGLFCTGLSYHQKISSNLIETIEIKERHAVIDINTAGANELERLPGVGPVLAGNIIAYRETAGEFKNIEELKNVKGIGDKKFGKIKDLVVISE